MSGEELESIFDDLFNRAKQADEFEYVSTLMRIRGIESAGWDTLEETSALFDDLTGLMDAPLGEATKIRLALLLYSHLTEVDALYLILINMVQVIGGRRYSFDPFSHLYRPRGRARISQIPPSGKSKMAFVVETAEAAGETGLVQIMKSFFNDGVRNAFFHSDYIIYQDEFRSRDGHFLQPDGVTTSSAMKLAQLESVINNGILFYQAFMNVFVRHLRSYTENVETTGRIHGNDDRIPLTILADEHGLRGFRSNHIGS